MRTPIVIAAVTLFVSVATAQDIVGLEDCAQARGPDKKIGCLQSNVGYLYGLIKKNETAAQARAREDAAKLGAAIARLDALAADVERLKARIEQLEKPAPAKPVAAKPEPAKPEQAKPEQAK